MDYSATQNEHPDSTIFILIAAIKTQLVLQQEHRIYDHASIVIWLSGTTITASSANSIFMSHFYIFLMAIFRKMLFENEAISKRWESTNEKKEALVKMYLLCSAHEKKQKSSNTFREFQIQYQRVEIHFRIKGFGIVKMLKKVPPKKWD